MSILSSLWQLLHPRPDLPPALTDAATHETARERHRSQALYAMATEQYGLVRRELEITRRVLHQREMGGG